MLFHRTLIFFPVIIALASMTTTLWAQQQVHAPARPGQGLSFVLGDYAEYTNTLYTGGKITSQFSTIMIATGQEGNRFVVEVLTVQNDKLSSRRNTFYDLQRASIQEDELLQAGTETISIAGKKFDCVWEKRRHPGGIETFWQSPELPFEKYAKVEMEGESGQKLVTELVDFGPIPGDEDKAMEFVKRLDKLNRESVDLAVKKKPRSLTFIYGLGGQNEYALVNSQEIRQRLVLSDDQSKQIQAIMSKADKDLTTLRLSTLKSLESDFADLKMEDKLRISKTIFDGSKKVNLEANAKVLKLLNPEQLKVLHQSLVQLVGARAVESDAIASMLNLTDEQKSSVAKLTADLEQTTAPGRVVSGQRDFDYSAFDKQLKELESKIRSVLLPEQRDQIDKLGK